MKVTVFCPECGEAQGLEPPDRIEAGACPDCEAPVPFRVDPSAPAEGPLETCPVCDFEKLYTRKDFPRKLGCLVVAIGAALSIPTNFLSLFVVILLEVVAYPFVPSLTGCYRCRSLFRGVARNPEHGSFDHGVALPLAEWKPPPRSAPTDPEPSPPTPRSPTDDPSRPSDRRS